jgi:quinol monooxygenase YgiN
MRASSPRPRFRFVPRNESVRRDAVTHNAKITAILAAKPGKAAELKELLTTLRKASRAEPGNLRWDIWQDQGDANRFVLDELYVDTNAVTAHRETPHFKNYVAKIADLADRTAIVSAPVEVE